DVSGDAGFGDFRIIQRFNLATGGQGDGRSLGFTDAGDIALVIGFTDGTEGVFFTSVPGPGAAVTTAIGLALATRRRR
ncbi:MAG: hypothetical protein AAGB48_13220, partial [Planctomycetota bacterium]